MSFICGMTSWINQRRFALIVVDQVGIFLKGIEGEGFNMKHWKSCWKGSKVRNYAFNLDYGN